MLQQPLEPGEMVIRERPQKRRHFALALGVDVRPRLHESLHLGKIVRLDGTAQRNHLRIGIVVLCFPSATLVKCTAGQDVHDAAPRCKAADCSRDSHGPRALHEIRLTHGIRVYCFKSERL